MIVRATPPITNDYISIVRSTVRRRVGRGGLAGLDREDVAQHALVELSRRTFHYDATRGPRAAFVRRIALNAIADLIARHTAARRDHRRCSASLDDTTSGAVATDERAERAVEHADLRLDLEDQLGRLAPGHRAVCDQLAEHSVTDTARRLGVSRSTVYDRIARVRTHFVKAGLDTYAEA